MLTRLRRIAVVFGAVCWLSACADGSRPAVEQAERDVLSIHDAIMPKIDDLLTAQRQLKARLITLDSTAENGSASSALRLDEDRNQARRLLHDLTVADSLMTRWMAHYRYDTLAGLPTDEALRYLDTQKASITDVTTKVNESLEHTRQFLATP
ncbi:viral A-type inclusion protein [Spirosoma rhododendri]|uniref:Viral A-type inclusion protein n=1 Tax=Spirosoma rhododendri TaxID=2728024 RepID=A0A7L5DR39_9BACT|nr:viral A-type inclusion protein [Spirosoma rhododendri]QJD80072.1 viral A-type inclusion protein [Spirosoma rhododendri]